MATLTPAFRTESRKIHEEHAAILGELEVLERALEHLVPGPQTDLERHACVEVKQAGRNLIQQLPEHCRHEEEKLHGPVGEVSPELAEFCRVMRREHEAMNARLWSFAGALDMYEAAGYRGAAAVDLKNEGKTFAQQLRRHIELEERELSGFL